MALSAKLEMRQSQSLAMTPQLMQAIKLLQYSSLDLSAFVDAELERNPLLERDEQEFEPVSGEETGSGEQVTTPEASADAISEANAENLLGSDPGISSDDIAAKLDTDPENVFPEEDRASLGAPTQDMGPGSSWSVTSGSRGGSNTDFSLESVVSEAQSLHDRLTEQLFVAVTDPIERIIGQHVIDEIDDDGYFRADVQAIGERLGAGRSAVEKVLQVIQSFEPTGVGARDLAECLALQLREKNRFDPAMEALIANLDMLARRELAELQHLCGVDGEDFLEMIGEIRALNPRPGAMFADATIQPVIPDVLVRPGFDGGWAIELNSDSLPRVLVNRTYYSTVAKTARNATDKTFLTDCLQDATWLVKSLDQRARTILKVATEIVRQQDAFFASGVQHLRPLNLRVIADAIGMHESTVSRATSNKFMATPRGIFEMKYFFTSAISSNDGGEAFSAESVRHKIKQLIDDETAEAVLSDDSIVKILSRDGIDIARRTVAKYRESMRIPSSVQRRREKKAQSLSVAL